MLSHFGFKYCSVHSLLSTFFNFPQQLDKFFQKNRIFLFHALIWRAFFLSFLVAKDHSICLHNLLQWTHWMQDSRITSKLIPVNLSLQIQPYLSVVDEIKRDRNNKFSYGQQDAEWNESIIWSFLKLLCVYLILHPCCPMSILCNIPKAYFFKEKNQWQISSSLLFLKDLLLYRLIIMRSS